MLTPNQKLQSVRGQIEACEAGTQHEITCPYCLGVNKPGDPLCCERFAKAAMAIIERQASQELIDQANRIQDRQN